MDTENAPANCPLATEIVPANCPLAAKNAVKPSRAKRWVLSLAESIDALRLIPRMVLIGYSSLLTYMVFWYMAIETAIKTECNAALIQILLDKNMDLEKAQVLACTIADMVGGPTIAQTALVTAVVGLAAPIFGFYATTGKKWGNGEKKQPQEPQQ
jgi:hypothetical protein